MQTFLRAEEVPRDEHGRILLCHSCQLGTFANRGLVPYLARIVIAMAYKDGAKGEGEHWGGEKGGALGWLRARNWVA